MDISWSPDAKSRKRALEFKLRLKTFEATISGVVKYIQAMPGFNGSQRG
jgi:hypothetical protein